MTFHTLHGVALVVDEEAPAHGLDLSGLLQDLSFVRADEAAAEGPRVTLSIRLSDLPLPVPRIGREVFRAQGLRAFRAGKDVYATDGSSILHVQVRYGRGVAQLAPAFFRRRRLHRERFWAFGLMTLLRSRGFYGLHAAGLATPSGRTVLLVGPSGSGKSSLTIGLVRHGWQYFSDDAILLQARPEVVEALALRKAFSVDAATATHYADLPLGPVTMCSSGRLKRRAEVQVAYPSQYVPGGQPQLLVFPRIVARARSRMQPLNRSIALGRLLSQSGPELFDQCTMAHHLETLARLVRQAATYELIAGRDLYRCPTLLLDLLAQAKED